MAMTIVIKAKTEANLAHNTARFETPKPTPQIGLESETGPEIFQVNIYKTEKSRTTGTS